ncbi:MAG: DUF4214 domain-containing protein [Enterocloster bolteae]|uniref:DUF4214 domain-containing protein n=1 Tax=Enterocloster bolteae TaxID=208479 RepID=UPI003994D293
MQNITFNTPSLLEITDDTDFIIQCYYSMLGRSLNPFEMRHALEMLAKGLSRKGFIYWITRSQEFGNRFVIDNITSSKAECYFYKGMEKLLKFLHLSNTPHYASDAFSVPLHTGRFGFLAEESVKHDYSFDTEYSALSEAQISQISSCLPELSDLTFIGHLASVLNPALAGHSEADTAVTDDTIAEQAESLLVTQRSSCFITNPDIIFHLLTTDTLSSFTNLIRDTLMLTMPQLPIAQGQIGVIWGDGWEQLEFDSDGTYCRWLTGPALNGSIHLINPYMDYCRVTLSFTMTVLDVNSEISVFFHGKSIPVKYSGTRCKVTLRLSLNPGCNSLSFHYSGKRIRQLDAFGRPALLSVDNLILTRPGTDYQQLSGEASYGLDEQKHGSGYYPFLLPDSLVRSQLHRSGFFEISAFHISKTYTVTPLPTTRYDYLRDERHQDCFYTFDLNSPQLTSDGLDNYVPDREPLYKTVSNSPLHSSVLLYIARRTGRFSPENYHYELEDN